MNVYGAIGYTLLKHNITNKKIIILADMHDKLNFCNNQILITEWLKKKIKSSVILLEEVPRENVVLEELWSNSIHTNLLKELFLNNQDIIKPIDIRPLIILFSLEYYKENNQITLNEYLHSIHDFFKFKNKYIIENIYCFNEDKLINTPLGKHFYKLKYMNFYIFLQKYKNKLDKLLCDIYDITLYHDFENLINNIMEWYICANIMLYSNKSIIIHTGLVHSEKVINLLVTMYDYKSIYEIGVNKIKHLDDNNYGCVNIPEIIDKTF